MAHEGSYFVLSMLDRLWHPDLTQDEAVELMEKGIEEVGWHFRLAWSTCFTYMLTQGGHCMLYMQHCCFNRGAGDFSQGSRCCSGSSCTLSFRGAVVHQDNFASALAEQCSEGLSGMQVRRRLVVAPPSFVIKVVDKDGIRTVKQIRAVS